MKTPRAQRGQAMENAPGSRDALACFSVNVCSHLNFQHMEEDSVIIIPNLQIKDTKVQGQDSDQVCLTAKPGLRKVERPSSEWSNYEHLQLSLCKHLGLRVQPVDPWDPVYLSPADLESRRQAQEPLTLIPSVALCTTVVCGSCERR